MDRFVAKLPCFLFDAAKLLLHTAKTCQYLQKNAKKNKKSAFFCTFSVSSVLSCCLLLIFVLLSPFPMNSTSRMPFVLLGGIFPLVLLVLSRGCRYHVCAVLG